MPTEPTFTCATCDVEIRHHPVFHLGLAFCCAGCAADGPCMCTYDAVEPAAAVAPAVGSAQIRRPAPRPEPAPIEVAARAPVVTGAAPLELAAARRR